MTYLETFARTSHNARLARLKFYACFPIEGLDNQSRLLEACTEHFATFSAKVVCFRDLCPYAPRLTRDLQAILLETAAAHTHSLTPGPNSSEVWIRTLQSGDDGR